MLLVAAVLGWLEGGEMPKVRTKSGKVKHYAYTAKGMAAAKKAASAVKKPVRRS